MNCYTIVMLAFTHPLAFVLSTWSMGVLQVSSTIDLHRSFSSLAVRVLMDDVKTTLFTEFDFRQEPSTFRTPFIAGSMTLLWT